MGYTGSGLFHLRKPPRIRKPPLVCPRSETRGGFLKCTFFRDRRFRRILSWKLDGKCIWRRGIGVLGHTNVKIFRLRRATRSKSIIIHHFVMIPKSELKKAPLVCPQSATRGAFLSGIANTSVCAKILWFPIEWNFSLSAQIVHSEKPLESPKKLRILKLCTQKTFRISKKIWVHKLCTQRNL